MKYVYTDLSQGMRRTQTRATTRSEQTMMVPIEAPPFIGLLINYNIFDGAYGIQQEEIGCQKQRSMVSWKPSMALTDQYDSYELDLIPTGNEAAPLRCASAGRKGSTEERRSETF